MTSHHDAHPAVRDDLDDDGSDVSSVGGREEFWRRSMRGWDVAFWVMVTTSAAFTVPTAGTVHAVVGALAGFVVLVVAYQLLGRRGAHRGDARLTQAYLVVLVLVTSYETGLGELGIVLLFVAYSQVWFFALTRVHGVLWAVALTIGVIVATALRVEAQPHELPAIAGQATLGLVFSLALGLWVTYVAEQSAERAVLVDELRAAQSALAASHHAEGVYAERARLAQEIHDTLAQGFTSVVMLAQTSAAELDAGQGARARERLTQIEAVARDNLAEARALVAAFTPPALDGGLAAALRRLAEQLHAQTGIDVTVEVDDVDVDQDAAVAVLRAAQESLANVRRHAGARRVTVRLRRLAGSGPGSRETDDEEARDRRDHVELVVDDDGRGFRADDREGTGLRGMRERARVTGGRLQVDGTPGAGTRVTLRLPVPARAPRTEDLA
ncbi:sensor histidine kinase [Cellulomonas persica]|uniref:histidine kinase n=1 Tax=Cellulomonas persica TaxID=76861 RepID=A0A510V1R0_9CELL|nr:two-component sensor histidine kinase [Cellulomonas persica]